jgi:hypothetical protein
MSTTRKTGKTARTSLRLTEAQRKALAEEAGPHGEISSVLRELVDQHVSKRKKKKWSAVVERKKQS